MSEPKTPPQPFVNDSGPSYQRGGQKKKSLFYKDQTQGSQNSINPEILIDLKQAAMTQTSIQPQIRLSKGNQIIRRTQSKVLGPLTFRPMDSGLSSSQPLPSPFSQSNGDKRTPQSHRISKKQVNTTNDLARNNRNSHYAIIFNHLANIKHAKQNTLYEIFTTFCEVIQTTVRVKNERFVQNLINKYGTYNPKIKEFVNLFPTKPVQWNADYLLRTMIQLQAELHTKTGSTDTFKKFRFDPAMIDSVIEMTRRLEDSLMLLQEDRYVRMAKSLIESNVAVNNKQNFVKQQMIETKRTQQLNYLNDMIKNRKQLNLRVLETDICEKLFQQEEKSGRFNLIQGLTRHASMGIDTVVRQMKQDPTLEDY